VQTAGRCWQSETTNTRRTVCRVSNRFFEGSAIMQWAVWIRLSDGSGYRFGVYDSREKAESIAALVGGVAESV